MSDAPETKPLLELRNITKTFEPGAPPVLDGLDLELHPGDALAVVGPSGSGKSTLLNIISALEPPTAGEVRLAGRDLAGCNDKQLAAVRNREIGFVFQQHHLLPQCTVWENVLIPTLPRPSAERQEAQGRAGRLLSRVGLGEKLHAPPGELSGGQRQRVAVVRAMINEPKLLLADEPTGSLDRHTAEGIIDLLVDLNRQHGAALIVVTHSADLAGRMQRTLELRDGTFTRDLNP
jgi:lipoprotein-releasing system ATP-binding protein